MTKIALLAAATFLVVFAVSARRGEASALSDKCVSAIASAGERYAREAFAGDVRGVEIKAWNDAMCDPGESEWMANVAVLVTLLSGGAKAAVIHLHLTSAGAPLFAGSFYGDTWHTLADPEHWRDLWCGAIESVYPGDARSYGCKTTPPVSPFSSSR